MIARRVLLQAALFVLFASPVRARKIEPARLNPQEQAEVARLTDYLNGIGSFSSHFQQYSEEGELATGRIFMRRPGRLRVEYDPPSQLLLVADGIAMNYYDGELDHLEQIPLQLSPLWFLLKEKISLEDDVVLIGYQHSANVFRLSLAQRSEPDAGRVTLEFGDHPLELRRWTITGPNEKQVSVSLYDAQFGVALENEMFKTPSRRRKGNNKN
ncbi:MAG TPA: outer membrane lipoprotein carrier protein LolA [Dongiaceae bacterium]|jgi:outer membrane lipoprotein-sorting protein|nr:outer membrane lipoprotein carrier protein LolA [Dongiaceae bacterium]